ncbi:MAG TPA: protoglobin domain-containing protein [Candidatus Polarisedimenticolaceae bacterium]|nr:protoglobin domain-containing protein [Candidatus Polarisedimenticolaceae bacterium]
MKRKPPRPTDGEPPEPLASFAERREFCQFGERDAELLAELAPTFELAVPGLVDRFYEHLVGTPALRRFLDQPATVERLKKAQVAYLLSLTHGRYDDDYAASRLRIGQVHERIGLEPQWYLGGYGPQIDMLLPHVHRHFAHRPADAVRASTALCKLIFLDMQLALDAYYGIRRRKELSRSEQLAAVGELAASIAHEVRNPLAGMKGALQVLRGELAVKPQNLEVVDELLAQIARLEDLVKDLLTFARPSSVSIRQFELQEVLDRLLRMYKDEADAARITIDRNYAPDSRWVSADPLQMEQVFFNLIHNAFQAMEDGGRLTVSTTKNAGGVVIRFRDTGKGIVPGDLTRIFQPFFTTKHRGSGLGLPIVKKIIDAHGGTIEVSSKPGQGTVATITLPGSGEVE